MHEVPDQSVSLGTVLMWVTCTCIDCLCTIVLLCVASSFCVVILVSLLVYM